MLTVELHQLLDLRAFVTVFPDVLGNLTSSPDLIDRLRLDAQAPLQSSDEIRASVRDLLRHGGFKPTGRSKPASEYLIKAAEQGSLSSVDACNVVSLHSGLPISVVDLNLRSALALHRQNLTSCSTRQGRRLMLAGCCACSITRDHVPTPSRIRSRPKQTPRRAER